MSSLRDFFLSSIETSLNLNPTISVKTALFKYHTILFSTSSTSRLNVCFIILIDHFCHLL